MSTPSSLPSELPRTEPGIAAQVFRLAWPAALQGLVFTSLFFTDRVMLGRFSADALASMQVSSALLWSVFEVSTAFAVGTVAIAGRASGALDHARVDRTALAALSFAMGLGVCVGLVGWLFRDQAVQLLMGGAASEAVSGSSSAYLGVLFPFMGASFTAAAATSILQSTADTRTPMIAASASAILHVAFNWVLIFGNLGAPRLGVVGAALGSGLAMVVNVTILLVVLARRHRLRMSFHRALRWSALRPLLAISRSTYFERFLYHAGFLVFAALVGRLGALAMATNQALIAVEAVGFVTAEAMGLAAAAIVARKLGAKLPEEAERAGLVAVKLSILLLLCVSAAFLLAPRLLLSLFATDGSLITLGVQCLAAAAVAQPFMAATHAFGAALRGAGDVRTPMLAALVGPGGIRLVATWFFAFHLELGLLGVWIGSGCDWLIRAVWLGFVFKRGRWKQIQL